MTTEADGSLIDRRIVIVSGKGGTGKTTVAVALGLAAAQRGKRVLIVEVGPDEHVPRLLEPGGGEAGYAGRELRPGLRAMRIDPFLAIAEYIGLQVGSRSLVDMALRNKSLRQLLEGAPGWRELITLGKIWHLDQQRDGRGELLHDLIIVDAPATGHGVTFLDVPRVVHSAVRAGPLSRNAGMVEELIRDPARTLMLPVSLAEDLPARESGELVDRVRSEVGIAVDRIVINSVARPPFPAGLEDMDQTLGALPADLPLELLPPPAIMSECAAYLLSRHQLNRAYVDEIGTRTQLPVLCLPYLPGGLHRAGALEDLGERLLRDPLCAPGTIPEFESRAPRLEIQP
jgi:hypothetical protein